MSESGTPEAINCEHDPCDRDATQTVRYCGGILTTRVCDVHAKRVLMIEREWDDAERDYLEQP